MTATITPIRRAALDGLTYAAYLVDYFGWAPADPDMPHLDLFSIMRVAAGKTALANGQTVYDTAALMGALFARHIETNVLAAWEAEPGRSAADVAAALRAAAQAS
jgi:hypothetical protein